MSDMLPRLGVFIALVLLSLWGTASARHPPRPLNDFSISYDVSVKGVVVGAAIWKVEPIDARRNLFRFELATKGVVDFFYPVGTSSESIWEYNDFGGVRPLHFEYTHSRRENRNLTVDFDWDNTSAEVTFRGEHRQEQLDGNTYDSQVFLLELGIRADAGENPIVFETIGNKSRSERRAYVMGEEQVSIGAGSISTLLLKYEDDEKITRVWYSRNHQLLPVIIEYVEKGGRRVLLSATSIIADDIALDKLAISGFDEAPTATDPAETH